MAYEGDICEVDATFGFRFLLLPKNHNNFSESLMVQVLVDSAQEWFDHLQAIALTEKFPGTKVAAPKLEPWGMLITYVWDPAGVLFHFVEPRPAEPETGSA